MIQIYSALNYPRHDDATRRSETKDGDDLNLDPFIHRQW